MNANRGAEVQLFSFSSSPLVKVGGHLHAPAALTMVLTEQECGWTPGESGRFGDENNLLLLPGFEPRIVQIVA
jgi:hypothetical protein